MIRGRFLLIVSHFCKGWIHVYKYGVVKLKFYLTTWTLAATIQVMAQKLHFFFFAVISNISLLRRKKKVIYQIVGNHIYLRTKIVFY